MLRFVLSYLIALKWAYQKIMLIFLHGFGPFSFALVVYKLRLLK